MDKLGFSRFDLVGHDRGGRVSYRIALDHPEKVQRQGPLRSRHRSTTASPSASIRITPSLSTAASPGAIKGTWIAPSPISAIRLDPKVAASYYYARGNARHDKRDNDRAIADFSEAIRLKPNVAPLLP